MTDPRKMMRDAPEMLMDLFETVAAAGRQSGMEGDASDAMALSVIETLERNWRGQQLYFGSNTRMRLRQRDLDIYSEFTGSNHAELAARYNVSKVWIYAVLRRVQAEINAGSDSDGQQSLL